MVKLKKSYQILIGLAFFAIGILLPVVGIPLGFASALLVFASNSTVAGISALTPSGIILGLAGLGIAVNAYSKK